MGASARCRACPTPTAPLAPFTPLLRDKFHDVTTVLILDEDSDTNFICLDCEVILEQSHNFKTKCMAIDLELKSHLDNLEANVNMESNIKMEELLGDNDTEDDFYVLVVNDPDPDPDKTLTVEDDTNNYDFLSSMKNEVKSEYEIDFSYNVDSEAIVPDELYDDTVLPKDTSDDFNTLDLASDTVHVSQNDKINIIELFKDNDEIVHNDLIKLEAPVPIVDNINSFPTEYISVEDSVTYTQEEIVVANGEDTYEIINCDISELDMESLEKPSSPKSIWQQEDGTFLCECGLYFEELLDYQKHVATHNKFTCDTCGKGFDSKEVFTGHMMLHAHTDSHLLCPFCMKNIKRHFFTSHITMHHSQFRPTCHICKKTFATEHNRKRHMLTHVDVKEYECDICQVQFTHKSTMQNHRLLHEIDHFKCNACLRDFTNVEDLKTHIDDGCENATLETMDTDNRKHICNKCGKTYATAASLRSHVDFVHGAQRNELLCSECGLVLLTKKAMYAHSYVHKQNRPRVAKRFCCRACGKACASRAMLLMHDRVHTNERPYKCKKCALAFKTKTHLSTHQLTHTQEKRFGCSVCLKFFALKGNLVVHLRTHTGERPYVCDICNQAFIDSKYLKKHKLRRHNSDIMYKLLN